MSSERYLVPDDLDALRRENELLTLENNYLKTRLAELQRELEPFREAETAPAESLVSDQSRNPDEAAETDEAGADA